MLKPFPSISFSCSLLRQGMKQICISTANVEGTANDSKEVRIIFRSTTMPKPLNPTICGVFLEYSKNFTSEM